jgi:hypothetical protein
VSKSYTSSYQVSTYIAPKVMRVIIDMARGNLSATTRCVGIVISVHDCALVPQMWAYKRTPETH